MRNLKDAESSVKAATVSCDGSLLAISAEFSTLSKAVLRNGGTGGIHPTDLYRENRVKIYSLTRGAIDKTLDGLNGEVTALSFSPDAHFLALIRQSTKQSFVDVYDLERGVTAASWPLIGSGTALAFSRDGRWLGVGSDGDAVQIHEASGVNRGTPPLDLRGAKYVITSTKTSPLLPIEMPLRLAVMDLEVNSAEPGMGRAIADTIRNRLNGTGSLQIYERRQWDQLLQEQHIQASDRVDTLTAVRLGRIGGVSKMLFGSVSKLGTTYTINVRLIEVETLRDEGDREVICQRCTPEDLPGAVSVLRDCLLGHQSR